MTRGLLSVVWAAAVVIPTVAFGQKVYTWKDEKGTVHFSDGVPGNVPNAQELSLGAAKPLVTGHGEPDTGSGEGAAQAPQAEGPVGPAEVSLIQHQVIPTALQQRHVTGRVKNVGGEPARRVGVAVRISDANQGTECLRGEIDVEPDELNPGDVGTFDEDIATPCWLGEVDFEIRPAWR